MPNDDRRVLSNECYLETLNELQSYVDQGDSVPTIVVGDFNTRLPQSLTLSKKWYKGKFSKRSAVLYDFICDNAFSVANFNFSQSVNHTWHNAVSKSYIDHVLVPFHLQKQVLGCHILSECPDNVSDHFALQCSMLVNTPPFSPESTVSSSSCERPLLPNWDQPAVRLAYKDSLQSALHSIPVLDPRWISPVADVQTVIDSHCDSLVTAMHEASLSARSSSQHQTSTRRRRHHWWNSDCTQARDRMRLFYAIWKSCDRPSSGAVYTCYRDARKAYRRICRHAVNSKNHRSFRLLEQLLQAGRPGKFWNLVRKSKARNTACTAIPPARLYDHFNAKLNPNDTSTNDVISRMEDSVQLKFSQLDGIQMDHLVLSEARVRRLIKRMRRGCSPGVDGVTPEHLFYSLDSSLPLHLSMLLTTCLRYGRIPQAFCLGRLVPVLKKPQLDPSNPNSYRPITVSIVLSKLLEMYLLEESTGAELNPCQFGFVEHHGTATAIALAHDISAYCHKRGSPVHLCSLDAEGAFDAIPHAVLFHETSNVLPDHCWRLLYRWYTTMSVVVCWNGHCSSPIKVTRGTRQGGLSSPFLFNVVYRGLIDALDNMNCGITINGSRYNVLCYADDILLASTTVSGLQSLIDIAVERISYIGLRFNPLKTRTMTYGKPSLKQPPIWHINGTNLAQDHCLG